MNRYWFSRFSLILSSLFVMIFFAGCAGKTPPPDVAPEEPLVVMPEVLDIPDELVEPEPVYVAPPKVALVLGGGGARGFAHVGVLRVLEKEKIPIDLIVGASVGSLIGAIYAAEPNVFELEWKALRLEPDDMFDYSFFAAPMGPVKGEAIKKFVRVNISKPNIEDLKIPFIAVATDLNTGEVVEITGGEVATAVRASVSIPGLFSPAKIGNRTLVDGGVVANVPVDIARAHGADIIIAVNITENVVDDNINNLAGVVIQAINIMMGQMAVRQLRDADVVISPALGNVGTLDFSRKKHCMAEGIKSTEEQVLHYWEVVAKYYTDRGGVVPENVAARILSLQPSKPTPEITPVSVAPSKNF